MQEIKVLSYIYDGKVDAISVLAEFSIEKYLSLVRNSLENLEIQRGRIISKKKEIYRRLIEDLKKGTVIPPISLALSPKSLANVLPDLEKFKSYKVEIENLEKILNTYLREGSLNILDGLQRTYCLLNVEDDLKDNEESLRKFYKSRLRTEIWMFIKTPALLYKMIVLNTGQVKMSLRHQIEILNMPLKDEMEKLARFEGKNIRFYRYTDSKTPRELYEYKLSTVIEAFTAFNIGKPDPNKVDIVIDELDKLELLSKLEKKDFEEEDLKLFVRLLLLLDEVLTEYYNKVEENSEENSISELFSRNKLMNSAPFLSGFFGAVGYQLNMQKKERITFLMNYLKELKKKIESKDPLCFGELARIFSERKSRTKKWGLEQRRLFYELFNKFMTEQPASFCEIVRFLT